MKSEKAKQFIKEHEWMDTEVGTTAIYSAYAYNAVELAEQEAEERMRKKAIGAFDDMWFENVEDGELEPNHKYCRRSFIQKLNEG